MKDPESKGLDKYERIRQCCFETPPYNAYAHDPRFVACVGANGNYGQDTICDGFCDAVQVLLCCLIRGGNIDADSIVYPILFCVRHSIELYLKDVYNSIQYICVARTHRDAFIKLQKLYKLEHRVTQRIEILNNQFDPQDLSESVDETAVRSHLKVLEKRQEMIEAKISELYNRCFCQMTPNIYIHDLKKLKEKILVIYDVDSRIKDSFDPVLPYITYFEDIDPRGDAFRYLSDHKGNPHLEKNRIRRIDLLAVGFLHKTIREAFEKLRLLLHHMQKEYETGTFTNHLSREQLKDISKMLPPPQEFTVKIKKNKETIKNKYQISSREFDKALDLIKRHREFSCNMGNERIFSHLSESTLKIFGECATGQLDWEQAAKEIHFDELCLLYTFSDISGWKYMEHDLTYYSENLLYLYRDVKCKHRITLYDLQPKRDIFHVINGMKKCGQITYATALEPYTQEGNGTPCCRSEVKVRTDKNTNSCFVNE